MKNYHEVFFGEYSFHHELKEGFIWNVDKYWQLEIELLSIIKDHHNRDVIGRELGYVLYYLSHSIDGAVQSTISPIDYWNIENLSIDEIVKYHDRFKVIMNIFWLNHDYLQYEYFLRENPFYQ